MTKIATKNIDSRRDKKIDYSSVISLNLDFTMKRGSGSTIHSSRKS